MLVTSLQGVDNPQDLSSITTGRSGVRENETDGLLGVNNEDRADGERNALGVDVGGVLVVDPIYREISIGRDIARIYVVQNLHVIGVGDLPVLITNDGELEVGSGDLINVLDPFTVGLDGVCRQTDELNATFSELRLELGKCAQLSGANGREVCIIWGFSGSSKVESDHEE